MNGLVRECTINPERVKQDPTTTSSGMSPIVTCLVLSF